MHCSVTIEGEKRVRCVLLIKLEFVIQFDDIFSDGDYAHKNPELSYGTDQGDKTVTFGSKGDIFWNIPTGMISYESALEKLLIQLVLTLVISHGFTRKMIYQKIIHNLGLYLFFIPMNDLSIFRSTLQNLN